MRKAAGKLEQFYDQITSARVVIGKPQHRHHKGDTYSVRLHLTIPDADDIAVSRDPAATGRHEDIGGRCTMPSMRPAADFRISFAGVGHVKSRQTPPHQNSVALHPGKKTTGSLLLRMDEEIYFHRNSVEGDKFDDLKVEQEVRFAEAVGDKGPQATSVCPIGKHHVD